MKLTSVTGVDKIENIKCFKPASKIFIVTRPKGQPFMSPETDPLIRVRLIDGRNGSSDELVPEMRLSLLSEIASKYEGFQRRSGYGFDGTMTQVHSGFSLSTILLGGIVGTGIGEDCAAVDLSNDKFLDIELKDLNPDFEYEIWGMENHIISPVVRKYKKFYLSQGELEKTFHVENNEVLVFPIKDVRELQMYAHNGTSPVFRQEELILDEDGRNDLVSVALDAQNRCFFHTNSVEMTPIHVSSYGYLPLQFGYSEYGVINLQPYARFDFRRTDGAKGLEFLMIDTMPTLPTSVANVMPNTTTGVSR